MACAGILPLPLPHLPRARQRPTPSTPPGPPHPSLGRYSFAHTREQCNGAHLATATKEPAIAIDPECYGIASPGGRSRGGLGGWSWYGGPQWLVRTSLATAAACTVHYRIPADRPQQGEAKTDASGQKESEWAKSGQAEDQTGWQLGLLGNLCLCWVRFWCGWSLKGCRTLFPTWFGTSTRQS